MSLPLLCSTSRNPRPSCGAFAHLILVDSRFLWMSRVRGSVSRSACLPRLFRVSCGSENDRDNVQQFLRGTALGTRCLCVCTCMYISVSILLNSLVASAAFASSITFAVAARLGLHSFSQGRLVLPGLHKRSCYQSIYVRILRVRIDSVIRARSRRRFLSVNY